MVMNEAVAQPHEVDLDQAGRLLAHHLPRVLTDLFGIDFRPAWPRGTDKKLLCHLRRVASAMERFQKATAPVTPKEAAVRVADLFAALVPPGMRIPKNRHPIDWLLERQGKVFRDLGTHPIGRKYLRGVNRIIDKFIEGERREATEAFLTASAQQEAMVVFPALFRRLRGRGFASWTRDLARRRPSMLDVPRLLEWYTTLAGIYEKNVCRLLGLLAIHEGKEPSYDALRSRPLATNMARLAKSSDMAMFVRGFNRPLRNAIAHEDVRVVLTQRRVYFRDRDNQYSLTPSQLSRQVVETTALVMSLFLLDSLCMYRRLATVSRLIAAAGRERRARRGTRSDLVDPDGSGRRSYLDTFCGCALHKPAQGGW